MHLKLKFHSLIKCKIRIGTYAPDLKNGGRARLISMLLNYFYRIKIFDIYLLINGKKESEYMTNENIKRVPIKKYRIKDIIKKIKKKKFDIFIYQFSHPTKILALNKIKNVNIIFYLHQSLFYWLYSNYTYFKSLYKEYQKSKYLISLISLENDYIFKKWGIKSILMDNFITYEFNSIFHSDLSTMSILMIGRGDNKFKRFSLGIQSMEYIIKEIPECEMKIISNTRNIFSLERILNDLTIKKNVKFYGYSSTPEIYFKNASLHIIPSLSESFSLVLAETKIYGIPNILMGLDYISLTNKETIIIYNDTPESLAKESIKILINYEYKKKLGKKERNNLKKYNNKIVLKKWIKIIFSIYNGYNYYEQLRKLDKKLPENKALNILKNQIILFKRRKSAIINKIENIFF